MPTFTSPFTGTVVQPTDVSFYALNFSSSVQLYWPAVVNPTQIPAARIIDATPSTFGLSITLPEADQGSVGSDILIRNLGVNSFTVNNFGGFPSITVSPGSALYFYLTDNTTAAGVWQNVPFGAGASAADAAALQGAGLTTIGGKLAVTGNIVTTSVAPTLLDSTRASTIVWTGGNGTINLPAANTLTGGWFIGFRNNGTGSLLIQGQGTTQINLQPDLTVNPGFSGYLIFQQSTGNFYTVGLANPATVTFTSATYDVDAVPGTALNLTSYAPIIQTYVGLSSTRAVDLDVTLPAITQLYVLVNNTGSSAYNVTFQISGSLQAPIAFANGQVATVLSDGNFLYVLSQTTTGVFLANNGSVSSPSFSFSSDSATGMYLPGSGIVALSANSTDMLVVDNSNTLDPQMSTPATFNAGLISGGTF